MALEWITPSGDLGTLIERNQIEIPIQAQTTTGNISYTVIAGSLPVGLRLDNNIIKGSPGEVRKFTTKKFVVRADNGTEKRDRTFSLSIDGGDSPEYITPQGFLNVGPGDAYFVLDNSKVDFQISATDPDLVAGENLEFFILPDAGELPPGLSLSKDGRISGFTDPVFKIDFNTDVTGSYDTQTFDSIPLDLGSKNTNGFDSFLFDNETFDYSEASRVPERLSRIYSFTVGCTDGLNVENRTFKIYVVTEEFLKADNNILEVDTNLFQADASSDRIPFWITDSYLGRYRANNYLTVFIDVYDPPSLPGTISLLQLDKNPDGSDSVIPPGMTFDTVTGEIAGRVPYQSAVTQKYKFTLLAINSPPGLSSSYSFVGDWNNLTIYNANEAVRFDNKIWIAQTINQNSTPEEGDIWTTGTTSVSKTFEIDIIGEIESAIQWITDTDLGTIKPNQPSTIDVTATSIVYGGNVFYEVTSGQLPPGLQFLSNGLVQGKVQQFADSDLNGILRFYYRDSSTVDSSASFDYNVIFDSGQTTFDKEYIFTVKASDYAGFAESSKQFKIKVVDEGEKSFANIYVKAFQNKQKRLEWYDFITDSTIFDTDDLYRYGDPLFAVQPDQRVLVYAGIESKEAVDFVQALSRNHYNKRLFFGEVKIASAKDLVTQEKIYDVVYIDVIDKLENNGKSISATVNLKDNINSPVLVSYDAIKVDSNIPFVSDADHQRIFPNSIRNMRDRLESVGNQDRDFLPLWMRSIQDQEAFEPGYTKALILCYAKPGKGIAIKRRIDNSDYDFKNINFEADRYIIDILDGEIQDKYLAFPQTGEKLP